MNFRILLLSLLPLLSFAQPNSKVTISINNQTNDKESIELKRNALYSIEEIKVRWKKAALENCPGVTCPTFSVPGPCSSIVATPTSPSSATVSFVVPTSDGGSPITGYIVTATSTPSAPAKRKSSYIITATGSSSPILVTGLTFSVNYIFSLVATNAAGNSPPITTTTTVTPCTLNTAGTASSSPSLLVNTTLTNIMISTTGATGIGTATGLPSGVTAVWSADVITISGTPTTTGTFNYTIPLTGGCGSVNATGSITVSAVLSATLTTTTVTSITATGASSGGNITVDGGTSITGRGIVWSTITGPTVSLMTKTTNGTGTGTFASMIIGLTASTTYYVRAYATNSAGTSYGNEVSFTTCTLNTAGTASSSPSLLVNTTLTNIMISTTGATGIGTATGLPSGVTAVWSADVITISGTPTTTGTFNYTIPLTGGCGSVNATGSITVSACPTATITDNGMNTYNTVTIGTQCWMKENLRVRKYNDGTEIRFDKSGGTAGDDSGQTWAGGGRKYGAYTIYAHDSTATPSNLASYGYLYNWYAAKGIASTGSITYKNICPTGWHVPTDSDWNKLIISIHSGADTTGTATQSTTAGGKMKSTGNNTASTGLWTSPNTGADNLSGFSALPGGFRSNPGEFSSIRNTASFWSATEDNSTNAWSRGLSYNNGNVSRISSIFAVGASVRCLRD